MNTGTSNASYQDKALQSSSFCYTFSKIIYTPQKIPIDFQIIETNEAFIQLIGKSRNEIINKRVSSLFPELQTTDLQWVEKYGRVATTAIPDEYEWYSSSLDKWFHLSITSPKRGFIVILSIDISRRIRAERDLQNREEMNRVYFQNTHDGIIILDKLGHIIKTNPAAFMFIEGNQDCQGMFITDSFKIAEHYDFIGIENALREQSRYQRVIHIHVNNAQKTVIEDIVRFSAEEYLLVWRDVSAEIKNRMEKELYFEVYNRIAQPTLVCDGNSIILTVNDSFTKMCGYSQNDIAGTKIDTLYADATMFANYGLLSSYLAQDYHALVEKAASPQSRYSEVEVVLKTKDNRFLQSYIIIVGLFNDNEQLTNLLFFPVDISGRRNYEEQLRIDSYRAIAELAELRDDETGTHMRRIGIFAAMLAKQLHMNEKFCHDISIFSPLHDIGKVGIPDSILLKKTKLAPEEQLVMQSHTTLGFNIVKTKSKMEMVAEITLNHHERFDGSGYPNGISGYDIPLAAQITSIVDIYDALRSVRPYKEPWTHTRAIDYIRSNAGTLFSPEIAEAFLVIEKKIDEVYQELSSS